MRVIDFHILSDGQQ